MTIEKVLEVLCLVGGYTADEVEQYTPLAQKNMACFSYSEDLTEADERKLVFLIATKTNYEIALIMSKDDGVESFSAGDITIKESKNNSVSLAKEMYASAIEDASGVIVDNCSGFEFRSV